MNPPVAATADAFIHMLDPVALSLGPLNLRWYPLTYIFGFIVAMLMVRWLIASGRSPITRDYLADMTAYLFFGVAAGARLGYVFFYRPELLVAFDTEFPFWGVLAVHKGGMSSHGGMLGVIAACFWMRREKGLALWHLFDVVAFICPPGLAFGRLGNWVNGELWGKALPATQQSFAGGDPPWWGVKYPAELSHSGFPGERLAHLRGDLTEHLFLPPQTPLPELLELVERAILGGDDRVLAMVSPALTTYYPSPIIQAITDGPLLMTAMVIAWWRPRTPGVVAAWFLVTYGVLRLASETWRQPDVGVALFLGLSRGQLLSVLFPLAGVVALIFLLRRGANGEHDRQIA